ncbi:MAG: hypothetical protein ACYTGZ_22980, partial [Planctomycetota bacterium]
KTALATNDFAALDFDKLQLHFGKNPGNTMNSPLFVHMVAGLGTGLFLFDKDGCAVNPLDIDSQRYGCENVAPKDNFDLTRVRFNLDRIVNDEGVATGASNHALITPVVGPNLRDGALNPNLAGPLGKTLIRKLTDPGTGIVLDAWIDADGVPQGTAPEKINPPPSGN